MQELISSGLGGLWVIPWLEWAKRSNWPVVRHITSANARYVSLAIAVVSAMGLHFSFDQTTRDWHVQGNLDMMLHGLVQYTVSHWGYQVHVGLQYVAQIARMTETWTSAGGSPGVFSPNPSNSTNPSNPPTPSPASPNSSTNSSTPPAHF